MERMTNARTLYVSLPVRDIARARVFWTKLGFRFNEKFSDGNGLCLILKEGSAYAMLNTREFFQTFTERPVADGRTSQAVFAIDVGSREKVDEVVRLALENGATRYMDAADYGWMYLDRFADPDGHQWEIAFMEEAKLPQDDGQTTDDARSRPLPAKVPQPALRALDAAGITALGQLAALGEAELLKLHGVGPKGVRILRQALEEAGLNFADASRKRMRAPTNRRINE